ncbi:MAG: hypothetical protein HY537_16550 [Deltaproteobacteria bacterium]|nr:hypothetical protein [Deltaproteobacteria bacterium]
MGVRIAYGSLVLGVISLFLSGCSFGPPAKAKSKYEYFANKQDETKVVQESDIAQMRENLIRGVTINPRTAKSLEVEVTPITAAVIRAEETLEGYREKKSNQLIQASIQKRLRLVEAGACFQFYLRSSKTEATKYEYLDASVEIAGQKHDIHFPVASEPKAYSGVGSYTTHYGGYGNVPVYSSTNVYSYTYFYNNNIGCTATPLPLQNGFSITVNSRHDVGLKAEKMVWTVDKP